MPDPASTQPGSWRARLPQSLPVRLVRLATEAAFAALVASYAVIICLQVFFRFVLNDSLVWSEELVRYGLLWGVMLGAAVATDRNAHIALAPLKGALGDGAAATAVAWICGLLVVAFCVVTAYAGSVYIQRLWNVTSPASQIPMRYVFAALPTGSALTIFFLLVRLAAGGAAPATGQARAHLS